MADRHSGDDQQQEEDSTRRPVRSVVHGGKLASFMTADADAASASESDDQPEVPAAAAAAAAPSRRTAARACTQVAKPAAAAKSKSKKARTTAGAAHVHSDACSHSADHDACVPVAVDADSVGDTFHCGECEGRGTLLLCDGPCGGAFHAECMPSRPDSAEGEPWFCQACFSKEHKCFICEETGVAGEDVFLCKSKKCGKFYHRHCLDDYPTTTLHNSTGFLCPRHKCASCHRGSSDGRGKFLMCLRCPQSFHSKLCLPPGAVYQFREGNVILCNTDRETPAATTDRSPDDDEDLEMGYEIAIHMPEPIVVPSAAFNPFALRRDAPTPTSAAPSPLTDSHMSDVDELSAVASSSSASPNSAAAASSSSSSASASASPSASSSSSSSQSPVSGASSLLVSMHFPSAMWTPPTTIIDFRLKSDIIKDGDAFVPKPKAIKVAPPKFKRVAANLYGALVQKPSFKVDVEPCMCAEQKDECTENCINRALYTECTRKCPTGDKCKNQRISRRQYAQTAVMLTATRGFGLIAKEDIAAGSLVIEYCGEIIDDDECTRRLNETEVTGNKEYYFFKIADDIVIDAGPIGNNARFLNHSCSPNCKTELWQVGCQKRVGIFTLGDVAKGTELTYDYNFEGFWQPGAALKCHCGAENCAGTLGGKKKTKAELKEMSAKDTKGGKGAKAKPKKVATKKRKPESTTSGEVPAAAAAAPVKRRAPPKDRSVAASEASPTADSATDSEGEDVPMDD